MAGTTRRNFLKKTAQAALVAGAGLTLEEILGGCATVRFKETAPVIYPPLKGHKAQPPENGCIIGFFNSNNVATYEYQLGRKTGSLLFYYEGSLLEPILFRSQIEKAKSVAKQGIIPIIFAGVHGTPLTEIVRGKQDKFIQSNAKAAMQLGKQHGGFFISTMWEMNVDRRYTPFTWTEQPTRFQQSWQHIWNIFEEEGANEYATWMIEYHVDFSLEGYWPGEKFVDWIGLSAYNRAAWRHIHGYRYLNDLIGNSYQYFRKKYPETPIMQSEFATTVGEDQPKWLMKAFQTIESKHGMKAAIYWDNPYVDPSGWSDDHQLSRKSLETLKEILKDPYWIMAK